MHTAIRIEQNVYVIITCCADAKQPSPAFADRRQFPLNVSALIECQVDGR